MSSIDHPNVASFAVATALAGMLATPAVTEAATIGYWRFEGDNTTWLNDSSGNGHHLSGSTANAVALQATGPGAGFHDPIPANNLPNASAFSFNNDRTLWAPDDDTFTSSTFTLEAYFNMSALNIAFGVIAGNWNSNGDHRGYVISVDAGGEVELMISSDGSTGNNERIKSGLKPVLNEDYYIAFAVDVTDTTSSGITFYSQQLSGTGAGELSAGLGLTHTKTAVANKTSPFTIGGQGNLSGHRFSGIIDEVRLSNTVLDRSELLAVPEPASLSLLSLAGYGLLARRRRN